MYIFLSITWLYQDTCSCYLVIVGFVKEHKRIVIFQCRLEIIGNRYYCGGYLLNIQAAHATRNSVSAYDAILCHGILSSSMWKSKVSGHIYCWIEYNITYCLHPTHVNGSRCSYHCNLFGTCWPNNCYLKSLPRNVLTFAQAAVDEVLLSIELCIKDIIRFYSTKLHLI